MRIIDKTLDYFLFFILASMSAIMTANVLSRFILNYPLYWGDELAQVLMVWLTFLGSAVAVREESHYSFDYLTRILKGSSLKVYVFISKAITLTAIILLLYWSTEVTIRINDWIMPAMGYSRSLVYGACPVGCVFMLYYGIRDLLNYK